MALRLEIISPQRQKLGARGSIVLGVAGGSIGRALDNDWALPDPNRYLSGHHARIHFRAGHYIVEDISSNGVFVNESPKPLGRRGIHRLAAGDILRMGEYRILVSIDEDDPAAAPQPGASTMANLTVHNVVPIRVPGGQQPRTQDDDLGHSLDIEALIPDITGPQQAPFTSTATMREDAASGQESGLSSGVHAAMQDRVARLRAAAKARLEGTSPALSALTGLQAFCRGAGIDADRLAAVGEAQAMHLVGRLLREALMGLRDILRAESAFKDRYGIRHEGAEGSSPLDMGIDEYIVELLSGHEQRRLDAVMRLRGHFTDAARHGLAVAPAVHAALLGFVAHLDPSRMDGTPPEKSLARYREIYAHLLRSGNGEVPHLFAEALAQAYLEERNRGR
ncbi:MAG: type VI secretion system-associated FHA domain protein TagH [Pseudomonadota bacterium]|jgi:type VI secretion system protein|nr:MAG: type VI secretion system-associated FHA domain protein TagH [Pseudomonadota bacterium]